MRAASRGLCGLVCPSRASESERGNRRAISCEIFQGRGEREFRLLNESRHGPLHTQSRGSRLGSLYYAYNVPSQASHSPPQVLVKDGLVFVEPVLVADFVAKVLEVDGGIGVYAVIHGGPWRSTSS